MKIESFSGEYRFLSNFWYSDVEMDGVMWPTIEHAFQAAKTEIPSEQREILRTNTPGTAKALGRAVTLRDGWDGIKLMVMANLVYKKFSTDEELRAKLIATGDAELIEGNNWGDKFWGVCDGEGLNHLGKVLMHVRDMVT